MCFGELSVIGEMFRACIVGDCVCCGMGDMSSCIGLVCVCVPSIRSFTVLKHIVLLLLGKLVLDFFSCMYFRCM